MSQPAEGGAPACERSTMTMVPPEKTEKMDGMDARVPMANNPVRVPERIAALIARRKDAKESTSAKPSGRR
ncbi:hypothetical protein KPL78_04170 [Roseomonas sp. HJA6]|uniref:Uncharacterized protein n=1 Tax=Roseomonas alba TaxID=2846776 RepID=A0ABS7A4B7_9PROT|nr:hypothetical protein [Neoroseomonas alba]MBW6397028.1 hypothetical protein [Neoroseomonas alba]